MVDVPLLAVSEPVPELVADVSPDDGQLPALVEVFADEPDTSEVVVDGGVAADETVADAVTDDGVTVAAQDAISAQEVGAVESAVEPEMDWDFGFEVVEATPMPTEEPKLVAETETETETDLTSLVVTDSADLSLDFDFAPVPEAAQAEFEASPMLLPAENAEGAADSDAVQLFDEDLSAAVATLPPQQDVVASEPADDVGIEASDDGIKVIGSIQMGAKLFNVYLSEAEEWSRRLSQSLEAWVPSHAVQPVPESAAAMAHSLAGASAAVGFTTLSVLARALEHALDAAHAHAQDGQMVNAVQARLFTDAADDVRRLLHQFAAGFLKEPSADILAALDAFVHNQPMLVEEPLPVDYVQADELVPADALPLPFAEEIAPDTLFEPALEPVADVEPLSEPVDSAVEPSVPDEPVLLADVQETVLLVPEVLDAPPSDASFGLVSNVLSQHVQPSVEPVEQVHHAVSVDDDIDAVDTLDADLFEIFEEEAQELFPRLGTSMRQWMARPDDASARVEVLRCLHTIKGSARLAGALRLGEMAHRIETQAERLGSDVSDSALVEPLLTSFDALASRFEELRLPGHIPVANRITTTAEQWPVPTAVEVPASVQAVAPPAVAQTAAVGEMATEVIAPLSDVVAPVTASVQSPSADGVLQPMSQILAATRLPTPILKTSTSAAVRVRPELLDRLVNQTGEVMISRSRMEAEIAQLRGSLTDLATNLERLRYQLRDVELQAESQMQTRMAQAKDTEHAFDPLEFDRFTRVQELTRMMAESVSDVATVQRNLQRAVDATEDGLAAQARQTRELQRDLLRTRMVEFEGISDRLYRVVRLASKETGKQVRLDIFGGSIEMDRAVLDRMTPAFEHLLRNCVGHGIESPAERTATGKTPEGNITIQLSQEGDEVSLVFADDGRGLNLDKIRQKALSIGLLDASSSLTDTELAQLIFAPGLTTATEVTGLSGRGIGMDVVRSEVAGLGGRVETSTEAGKGTRFRMVLPLTTAVTQVVMVRAGDFALGMPSGLVELVRRVNAKDLAEAYASGHISVGGETVPFYWVGALLQMSRHSDQTEGRTFPVVIFRSASQRVALHVDEVLGNQEVVVKNLGPQLSRLPGLAAMTVLASGAVALIYNPVALASVYGNQVQAWLAQGKPQAVDVDGAVPGTAGVPAQPVLPEPTPVAAQLPLVLVVDDSITVRRVTQRLLVREGFRVTLAADGLQALEKLQDERPAVVLSDIEMPRMDGFDLVRNIRADVRLADLPVIMITSRIAEKHREHARQLGVDHYLGKPYAEDVLLGLLRDYCRNELVTT